MKPVAHLAHLCRRWGGSFESVDFETFRDLGRCDGWSCHPSGNHAINVGDRRIIAVADEENPGAMIHEMGHVFLRNGHPSKTYEPDWLGWEIVMARRARCYREWSEQNNGYTFTWNRMEREWGALQANELRPVISYLIRRAIRLGSVSRSGEPRRTRKP